MLSILIFLFHICLCVDNFLVLKIPLDVYSTSRGLFFIAHFLQTCLNKRAAHKKDKYKTLKHEELNFLLIFLNNYLDI